jgi:hypothetical protein
MAGAALTVVTLVACILLLILVRLELSSATTVHYVDMPDPPSPPPPPVLRATPPPPPSMQVVLPTCQVTFGKPVCMCAGLEVPCPAQVDQVRHDTQVSTSGAWLLSPTYTYFLDRGLVGELARLFAGSSVIELGAGKGCYAAELQRAPPQKAGASRIAVRAFDGAPNVVQMTGGLVQRADLTAPMPSSILPAEWVLCLETAEHIPRAHEAQLLGNLDALNTVGIVLSWSNNAGGNGHVNLRTNEWAVRRFAQMGYDHDERAERALRRSVNAIHWFRDTIMVFRRRAPAAGSRRGLAAPPERTGSGASVGGQGSGDGAWARRSGDAFGDVFFESFLTTPSGLQYQVVTPGAASAVKPRWGQAVTAHYAGYLLTGNLFDCSYDRRAPLTVPVGMGKVIKGWDEALLDMRVGEKRMLRIPPELAYGARGAGGGAIPPDAVLIFYVELLSVG